jgi:hypothetical protein
MGAQNQICVDLRPSAVKSCGGIFLRPFAAIPIAPLPFAALPLCVRFLSSVSGQAAHKRDQALDLFLCEIGIRRHRAAFTDGGSSALNDGPNPVIGGRSLPASVSQVLRFLS